VGCFGVMHLAYGLVLGRLSFKHLINFPVTRCCVFLEFGNGLDRVRVRLIRAGHGPAAGSQRLGIGIF
jgi:hypothetical protein